MEKPHVLLMFLGGSPNSTNIVNHWITMNRRFINKDRVFVVVHPKTVTDKISADFKNIFKEKMCLKLMKRIMLILLGQLYHL